MSYQLLLHYYNVYNIILASERSDESIGFTLMSVFLIFLFVSVITSVFSDRKVIIIGTLGGKKK